MRLTALKITTQSMSLEVKTTDHNSLRWAMMAVDVNVNLSNSLIQYSVDETVFLTDSIYLLSHNYVIAKLPKHTHIILWDGINSYLELVKRHPDTLERSDLVFFVVGWLKGIILDDSLNIQSLYPLEMPEKSKFWNRVFAINQSYYAPYWYRGLTAFLTFTRYFKNWVAESKRHKLLCQGGKIVFCGLVTPSEHHVNCFFIGANLTILKQACDKLTHLTYVDEHLVIDSVLKNVINALRQENLLNTSDYACVYSILNVLHRIKTLALLDKMTSALFVNETSAMTRIDPYDSFFYKNNLYLDFGSTRGPDAIYPRTLDMSMTDKKFISLRYLPHGQTLKEYLEQVSVDGFLQSCKKQATTILQQHSVFARGTFNGH